MNEAQEINNQAAGLAGRFYRGKDAVGCEIQADPSTYLARIKSRAARLTSGSQWVARLIDEAYEAGRNSANIQIRNAIDACKARITSRQRDAAWAALTAIESRLLAAAICATWPPAPWPRPARQFAAVANIAAGPMRVGLQDGRP